MEINQANLDFLFKTAELKFGQVLTATQVWHDQIATTMPGGNTSLVVYAWMARVPTMRKWLGTRQINAISTHSRAVVNEPYEQTLGLDKFDVEDDQFGIFNMNLQFQAAAAKKLPDQQLAQFLRTANTTLGYDGKGVYATDHPTSGGDVAGGVSGTQSNLFTSKALTYENYVTVRTSMMAFKGEDNQPLTVVPDLLVVPPQLEGKAKNILEADLIAGVTQGGTSNVLTAAVSNVYKGTAKILVIPELADYPNNWWLLDTKKPVKPFIWQERTAPKFSYLTSPTDPNVFLQHQFLYGVEARGAPAESLWFLSAAATSETAYIPA